MTEISVVAQEIVASRQRGMPADEGKLWETLRLDAERALMGEEMLRGFLDLAVLRHDGFASGLGLLLAHKLAEYSMPAERLGEIARSDGRRSGDHHRGDRRPGRHSDARPCGRKLFKAVSVL